MKRKPKKQALLLQVRSAIMPAGPAGLMEVCIILRCADISMAPSRATWFALGNAERAAIPAFASIAARQGKSTQDTDGRFGTSVR